MPSRRVSCSEAEILGFPGVRGTVGPLLSIVVILYRTSEEVASRSPRTKWKLSTGELQSMHDRFFSPTMLRVPVKHEEQNICEQGERTIIRQVFEDSLSQTEQAEFRSRRSSGSDLLDLNRP
jgi:hypothetical protein